MAKSAANRPIGKAKIIEPKVINKLPTTMGSILNLPSKGNQESSKKKEVFCPAMAIRLSFKTKRKIKTIHSIEKSPLSLKNNFKYVS